MAGRFARKGVAVIGVMPNDVDRYPDDTPAEMVRFARSVGWDFPYLYDESQAVALAYRAACTPDFYAFDADRRLVYRGQFDGARPSNDVAGHRQGPPRRGRRGAGRRPPVGVAAAVAGLLDQVEAGRRTRLVRLTPRPVAGSGAVTRRRARPTRARTAADPRRPASTTRPAASRRRR